MLRPRLTAVAICTIAAIALAAFLAGRSHAHGGSGGSLRTVRVANALLAYPPGWRRAPSAPAIPGLALSDQLALAPAGDAANAGLLAGALPAGQPDPLPSAFLAALGAPPDTAVVGLLESQAYRYTGLRVPAAGATLALFVIPNPGGSATALACYATPRLARAMSTCQQIVASLTLVGQAPSYGLIPDPTYGARVRAAILALQAVRASLARELGGGSPGAIKRTGAPRTPAIARPGALRLAQAFAAAAASLSGLEPAAGAQLAQATLAASLTRARAAYSELALAAGSGDPGRYQAAIASVRLAEASVDRALESFALLGYART